MMTYSALIQKPNGDQFWTPMYSGGPSVAARRMRANSRIIECSIYRNGRFVQTVHPTGAAEDTDGDE